MVLTWVLKLPCENVLWTLFNLHMILMTLELPIKEKMTAFDWFLIMSEWLIC